MSPRWTKTLARRAQALQPYLYPLRYRMPMTLRGFRGGRVVIVAFSPLRRYGGWVDRLKGIISSYELARMTGRSFRLDVPPSFPVLEFLEPVTFDWRAGPLTWNPLDTSFHVSRDRRSRQFVELQHARRPRLYVDTNLDYLAQLHPDASSDALARLWKERFDELFRMRSDLADTVGALARPGALALHARFTGLLGDFKDVVSNALPASERDDLRATCVRRVAEELNRAPGRRVIVFSDSSSFLNEVTRISDEIVVLPGAPQHIDHVRDVRAALHKTVLDFFVMTRCAEIKQLRIGPMYNSAFSRYASFVGAIPFTTIS